MQSRRKVGFWGLVPANFGQIIYKPIQIMHTARAHVLSTGLVHNNLIFRRPCTRRTWWDNQSQVCVHFAAAASNHKLNQKEPVIKNVGAFLL